MASYSVPAEKSALGCCLISEDACGQICNALVSGDFYEEAHQAIFSAILSLYNEGAAVDLVTVSDRMEAAGSLDLAGGIEYLADIARYLPSDAHANEYIAIIQDHSRRRKLFELSQSIAAALDAGEPTESVLSTLTQAAAVAAEYQRNFGMQPMGVISDAISQGLQELCPEAVIYAIHAAKNAGTLRAPWRYMSRVIESMVAAGVKDMAGVEAYKEQVERQSDRRSQPKQKTWEESAEEAERIAARERGMNHDD